MRTSCREFSPHGMQGYWRGAREFLPQGTFEEVVVVERVDATHYDRPDGVMELIALVKDFEHKCKAVRQEIAQVTGDLQQFAKWQFAEDEMRRAKKHLADLQGQLAEMQAEIVTLNRMI